MKSVTEVSVRMGVMPITHRSSAASLTRKQRLPATLPVHAAGSRWIAAASLEGKHDCSYPFAVGCGERCWRAIVVGSESGGQSAAHQRVHGSHARRGGPVHDGHQNEDENSADGNTGRCERLAMRLWWDRAAD